MYLTVPVAAGAWDESARSGWEVKASVLHFAQGSPHSVVGFIWFAAPKQLQTGLAEPKKKNRLHAHLKPETQLAVSFEHSRQETF